MYNNHNSSPRLQIHPLVIGTNTDGKEGLDNDVCSDHNGEDFSNSDLDQVLDDIEDDDKNVHTLSVGNPIRGIVIRNDLRAHMLSLDPDTVHASEFPKYSNIIPSHQLVVDSELEEFFVGKQFANKEECLFAMKKYSMKVSMEYKFVVSKPILYVGECWRFLGGCNWWIRASFI